jgi:hypothetical protein
MPHAKNKDTALPQVEDEPGMAERFQRGLQRAFQMPHKPIAPKAKDQPAIDRQKERAAKRGRRPV